MRNIPGYPASTDVREPIARVVHGGKDREFHGLSLTRELPSSVHAQVARVGGITQADGRVEWAAEQDVVESYPTAFGRASNWPPRTRDKVDVWFGYRTATGDLLAKTLTGFVKDSAGDPADGYSSGLVDPIARLSRKLSLPPLQSIMPPAIDGGEFRHIRLFPTFFTDAAARAAGFYATPAMSQSCVLSAPLMGSAWPERGAVTSTFRAGTTTPAPPTFVAAPWGGLGVCAAALSYVTTGQSTLDRPMEITAMAKVVSGVGQVRVSWANLVLTMVRGSGAVQAQIGSGQQVCRLVTTGDGPVTMRVEPSGNTLKITLRDQSGKEADGTTTGATTGPIISVEVLSPSAEAIIGGVQVAFPTTAWAAVGYTRSAFIGRAAHNASLLASPALVNITARSLLEDQSRAEMAALWIDEDGYLQWRNRNDLVAGAPVTTLTTKDHVHNLPWEEDFTGVSSMVEVTGRKPETLNRRQYPTLEVWRSNYGAIEGDGTDEFPDELIHPGSDIDWIMVDTSFGTGRTTRGKSGSVDGYYYFFENGKRGEEGYYTVEGVANAGVQAVLQFVDHRTYKLSTSVGRIDTSSWTTAELSLRVPDSLKDTTSGYFTTGLRSYSGMNLPLIRAKATTGWVDVTYTADAGVWDAPVLTHDVGWFVQDAAAVQEIADLLAAATTTPQAFLSSIDIVPDPRLQRADIITLEDREVTGLRFRCLLIGITDTLAEGGAWSQSASFRLLSTTTL